MSEEYTREWWKERLPLIQAFVDNKKLLFDDEPTDERVTFAYQLYRYRIAPEPKLRPWNRDEAPLGAWLRWAGDQKHHKGYAVIGYVDYGGVPVPCGKENQWLDFQTLMEDYEHSTDGGRTWSPCGVLESQV